MSEPKVYIVAVRLPRKVYKEFFKICYEEKITVSKKLRELIDSII